jgi:hypothetical protein
MAKTSGMAYGGGKLKQWWSEYPLIIDLESLRFASQIPLLLDHFVSTDSRAGIVTAKILAGKVYIDGEILSESEKVKDVKLQASKKNGEWQLSVRTDINDVPELVKEGIRRINNQDHQAPFYHVRNALLREVSITPLGVDGETRLTITASEKNKDTANQNLFNSLFFSFSGEINMADDNKTNTQPAPTSTPIPQPQLPQHDDSAVIAKAKEEERARVIEIKKLCTDYPDIEASAISEGWNTEKTAKTVLAKIRDDRANVSKIHAPNIVSPIGNSWQELQSGITASLCLQASVPGESLHRKYGDKVMEFADKHRNISLREICIICAKNEGKNVFEYGFGNEQIVAAFSTVSLPGILSNVAEKALMMAFGAVPGIARILCTKGSLSNFKTSERYRLNINGDLEQVAPDGQLKDATAAEDKATNKLETYGKAFSLTRQMIINDDLGAFLAIPRQLGAKAGYKVEDLFFSHLLGHAQGPTMEDNVRLFHAASHLNYQTGVSTALGYQSFANAIQYFLQQKQPDTKSMNVPPRFLVVPTELYMLALQLTKGNVLIAKGFDPSADFQANLNPASEMGITAVQSANFSNSNYTGYSTKAWYLWGDPRMIETIEIGYLDGRETPTLAEGKPDWRTLGYYFIIFFDCGVRVQEYRGLQKNKGEA